ncbi:MAG TPA: TraR/DksA C4-type zinc finger protein [Acidimicrobiales bacterium]|nr:TraR/DksA C4-type zinc finger protein [Acidimicrobiales bacterium]
MLAGERGRIVARVAGLERDLGAIVDAAALDPPDDEHDPEGSTVGFERALVIDLLAQARQDLADLDDALARLDTGTYGACEVCGRAVPPERLAAHPTARMCVACAEAQARAAAISSRVRGTL